MGGSSRPDRSASLVDLESLDDLDAIENGVHSKRTSEQSAGVRVRTIQISFFKFQRGMNAVRDIQELLAPFAIRLIVEQR